MDPRQPEGLFEFKKEAEKVRARSRFFPPFANEGTMQTETGFRSSPGHRTPVTNQRHAPIETPHPSPGCGTDFPLNAQHDGLANRPF